LIKEATRQNPRAKKGYLLLLSHRPALILYWTSIIGLLLLLTAAPRGCTSTAIESASGINGNPSVTITPEGTITEKSKLSLNQRFAPPEIYSEEFIKNDWLFVVFYNYNLRADLSLAPKTEGTNITLKINMPGNITTANANRIEKGVAAWKLKFGRSYKMEVASRRVRWSIATLTGLLFVIFAYSWLSIRAIKPETL